MSRIKEIHKFIKHWRLCTSELIRSYSGIEDLNNKTLQNSLNLLRHRKEIKSIQIGSTWYHLDRSFWRRASHLQSLPMGERYEAFSRIGLVHDIFLVEIGMRLEQAFSGLVVFTNLFKSYVSFTRGTTDADGKKYIPDIIVYHPDREDRQVFVEFERYVKSYSRCSKLWSIYEQDESILGTIYIAPDQAKRNLLHLRMRDYVDYDVQINPNFYLATLKLGDLERDQMACPAKVFTADGESRSDLYRLLSELEKPSERELQHG